jgi:hypothetical protein
MKKQIIGYLNKDVRDVAGDISKGYQRVVKGVDNLVIDVQANLSIKAAGIALVAGLSACTPAMQVKSTANASLQGNLETTTILNQYQQPQLDLKKETRKTYFDIGNSKTALEFYDSHSQLLFLKMMDANGNNSLEPALQNANEIIEGIDHLARYIQNPKEVQFQLSNNKWVGLWPTAISQEAFCDATERVMTVGKESYGHMKLEPGSVSRVLLSVLKEHCQLDFP